MKRARNSRAFLETRKFTRRVSRPSWRLGVWHSRTERAWLFGAEALRLAVETSDAYGESFSSRSEVDAEIAKLEKNPRVVIVHVDGPGFVVLTYRRDEDGTLTQRDA